MLFPNETALFIVGLPLKKESGSRYFTNRANRFAGQTNAAFSNGFPGFLANNKLHLLLGECCGYGIHASLLSCFNSCSRRKKTGRRFFYHHPARNNSNYLLISEAGTEEGWNSGQGRPTRFEERPGLCQTPCLPLSLWNACRNTGSCPFEVGGFYMHCSGQKLCRRSGGRALRIAL